MGYNGNMLSESDRKIVESFRRKIEGKVPLRRILVFGSRARGDATWESDLDLLVEIEHRNMQIEEAISLAAWEAGFPDVVVVPVTVTRDELENSLLRSSTFIREVRREGIAA